MELGCPLRSPRKACRCRKLCCFIAVIGFTYCVKGQGYEPPTTRSLGVDNEYQRERLQQLYRSSKGFQKKWSQRSSRSLACNSKRQAPGAPLSLCAAAASGGAAGYAAYRQLVFATSPTSYSSANASHTGGIRLIQAEPGNQEPCNTCTAFAVVAAAQAAAASSLQLDVQQLLLSVQDLFYCSPAKRSCQATWNLAAAVQELQQRQLLSSNCLPYIASYQPAAAASLCTPKCKGFNPHVSKGSFSYEMVGDEWEAQRQIRESGAVVTSFEVMDDFRSFFSKPGNATAVYAPKPNPKFSQWHAVAIVGYHGAGSDNGYWLCLNSWGKNWADGGLFRVKFGCCGMLTEAYAVKWSPIKSSSSTPKLPLRPAQGRKGCYVYQSRPGDFLSRIAARVGISIEQLLLDNVDRLDSLDASPTGKHLLICNPGESVDYTCTPAYDMVGTDIQGLNVDQSGCREACSRNADCTFYVFLVDDRFKFICWLKKDFGTGPQGTTGTADWVVNMCKKTDLDSMNYSCKEMYDVAGKDILAQGVNTDQSGCREACNRNAVCTFFVYIVDNRYGNRCWLKKDYGNGPNGQNGPSDYAAITCKRTDRD